MIIWYLTNNHKVWLFKTIRIHSVHKSVGHLVLLVSHAWRLAASWLIQYDLMWDDWDDLALPYFVSSFSRLAQVGLMAKSEEPEG